MFAWQNLNNAATQRVVALVDMDCFYCQVETRLNPSLKGKAVAVVQYNQWKGGGIIAVNYEARDRGVKRYMRGDEAKEKCPEIVLVPVPTLRGKADLSNYRDAGDEVAKVFSEYSDCVQRASIDEAYLDLTKAVEECIKTQNESLKHDDLPNTFIVGHCNLISKSEGMLGKDEPHLKYTSIHLTEFRMPSDRKEGLIEWLSIVEREKTRVSADYKLAVGARIVEKMRAEILRRTGFHCSAGIAHNKILAKLTAGLHKPKRQTLLPQDAVPELYETLPIYKVRNLGGKLGNQVADKLCIKYMSELSRFSLSSLQEKFDEKTSAWLYNIARGIDLEPVTCRLRPESIGCCKNFPGKNALISKSDVEHWLKELALEISERLFKDLEKNKRRAKLLTVSFSQETPMTRCGTLSSYEATKIVQDALDLLKKFNSASANEDVWSPPIRFLGLSASKFTEELSSIEKYFKNCKNSENLNKPLSEPSGSKTYNWNESKELKNSCKNKHGLFTNTKMLASVDYTPTCESNKKSFFLEFLNSRKYDCPRGETSDTQEGNEEENEEKETWISLSEVFPDLSEAEADVIESLPEAIKKKYRERVNGAQKIKENSIQEEALKDDGITDSVTDTCNQCGKSIPVSELPVHLDYHAALKLYSEINKEGSESAVIVSNRESKDSGEKERLTKRKKRGGGTPSKKMKSLTSFFAPLTKD